MSLDFYTGLDSSDCTKEKSPRKSVSMLQIFKFFLLKHNEVKMNKMFAVLHLHSSTEIVLKPSCIKIAF